MRKFYQWGSALLAILFFQVCFAAASNNDINFIRESLKQHLPQLTIENIAPSPVKGVYQVTADSAVIYMSNDGRYAFSGDIIDLADGQNNLTESARKKARVASLKTLGEEDMVIFSPKDPKYTIIVFTDVDCGYCRKLQADMEEINAKGIAIRYLAFPRSGPNTPAFDKMVRVWCSKDKNKALLLANQDKSFDGKECGKDTIMRQFELGIRMGVNGTPTLIFEDGTLVPGYMPPDKLLEAAKEIREKMQKKQSA